MELMAVQFGVKSRIHLVYDKFEKDIYFDTLCGLEADDDEILNENPLPIITGENTQEVKLKFCRTCVKIFLKNDHDEEILLNSRFSKLVHKLFLNEVPKKEGVEMEKTIIEIKKELDELITKRIEKLEKDLANLVDGFEEETSEEIDEIDFYQDEFKVTCDR